MLAASTSLARDNGQYAQVNPEIKDWFSHLSSKRGLCCADADGTSDPDWMGKKGADGNWHYQVKLKGNWIEVPDEAVITEPNKVGRTIVWTYDLYGTTFVRCFMPGPGA
jgi:hypothetical protein